MISIAKQSMKATALRYAAEGYPVFPCRPKSKKPLTTNGFKDANTDESTIRDWWSQHPHANVAIPTAGLVVVDIDPLDSQPNPWPSDPSRRQDLRQASAVSRTPRGGLHFFFRRPEGKQWRCGTSVLADGVDIRTDGGYIVVAPSATDDGTYEWLSPLDCEMDELTEPPEWLADQLDQTTVKSNGQPRGSIPHGQRNDTLFRFAFRHAHRSDVGALVQEENRRRCSPPLDEVEIEKLIGSAVERRSQLTPEQDAPSVLVVEGRTDAANARRLIARHGLDVRWCDPWSKWLVWDGRRWAVDDERRIETLAKEVSDDLWPEVFLHAKTAEAKNAKTMFSFARSSNGAAGIRNTVALARSEPGIPILPKDLDQTPWLLNVKNGTLDLRSGDLREHDRADLITKLAPVEYDAEARCPTWMAFLKRVLNGERELHDYLQRLVGYCLTGSTREHILPFLYGVGANGKSTFVSTILSMLGTDYAIKAAAELLLTKRNESHPTERADLHGKRFVACIEAEDGRRMAEAMVKELTGGDRVRARRMKEDFWEFSATHKIWLAANHKPIIRGTDHGIWRRVKLIPFLVTIPDADQDKELTEKLKSELGGILNWALSGCRAWQQHGLGEPGIVRAATGDYKSDMDIIGRFVNEKCEVGNDVEIGASDLYREYKKWCEETGERPATQTVFGTRLTERGIGKKTVCGRVRRVGISIM